MWRDDGRARVALQYRKSITLRGHATLAARVTALADRTFATLLSVHPESGTHFGLTDAEHERLNDNAPDAIRAAQSRWDALRADVAAIDPLANLRQGLTLSYRSPKVIVGTVIGQVDDLLATPVTSSPFCSPAQRDTTPAFGSALAGIIGSDILPAMRRCRDFLSKKYLGKARAALGVTANPNGHGDGQRAHGRASP